MNIREQLIKAGIGNLQEFGYPQASEKTILTDAIYKAFFARMLKDNKGHSPQIDAVIDELLAEVA